ncbi:MULTISPECIES: T6SS immunity protein Tli4 family protein [unclassified Herbaspirillum]|uniref:T6SS immunity protein Tli4 family protein n=1 Tax=unclassified Herbaspirillum TaxID=2624150 RepID=UPI000558B1E1|nr:MULTISPECIES: T6SS immunity protein Tli4 family protein [unclassified Herbaspirillum]
MNIAQASRAVPSVSTFCTGRFMLDMPAGSVLSGGNYQYDFARLEPPQAMSLEEFGAEIDAKVNTLKSIKHETDPSLLRMLIKPDQHSRILVYWEESFIDEIAQVEGYRWIDGTRYLFKTEAGMSPPPVGMPSYQDDAIERMRLTLAALRKRATHDIPQDPGYCFEGGFIANPDWENEEAGIDIDIAGHPDAFVSVWFYPLAMSEHDRPLLDRMSSGLQTLGHLATAVRTLRKGERQVGPYQGQEFLVTTPNSGGGRSHSFIWETEGQGSLDTPAIKIELTTGHHDKNSNAQPTRMTDAQALQLWDEVLNSFRLRPTRGPQASSPSP